MTQQQQPLLMLRLWAAAVVLASPMMMRGAAAAAAAVHLELQLHPVLGPSVRVSALPRCCAWQSAELLSARKRFCEWIQPYDMFAAVDSAAEVPCCTSFCGEQQICFFRSSLNLSRLRRGCRSIKLRKKLIQLQVSQRSQGTRNLKPWTFKVVRQAGWQIIMYRLGGEEPVRGAGQCAQTMCC